LLLHQLLDVAPRTRVDDLLPRYPAATGLRDWVTREQVVNARPWRDVKKLMKKQPKRT